MTFTPPPPCTYERDVLDLVAMGQWPTRADQALRAHVAQCPECTEVAAVAAAVHEWADHVPPASVPDASVVWYRAQVRAREDAARRATRPVLVAQIAAFVAVAVAVAVTGPGWDWVMSLVPEWSPSLPTLSVDVSGWWPQLPTVESVQQWSWFSWLVLGAGVIWLVVGSIAVALATRD